MEGRRFRGVHYVYSFGVGEALLALYAFPFAIYGAYLVLWLLPGLLELS